MVNIVLPLDFSDTTDKLVKGAINFARQTGGKVFIIHVAPADIGFAIGDMGFQYFPEVEQHEIREELLRLNNIQQTFISEGIPCEHILKQGVAKEIILDYVKEKRANYLVLGSHGRSGFYDVFVGSLTKGLTKDSHIPVLVIPCQS